MGAGSVQQPLAVAPKPVFYDTLAPNPAPVAPQAAVPPPTNSTVLAPNAGPGGGKSDFPTPAPTTYPYAPLTNGSILGASPFTPIPGGTTASGGTTTGGGSTSGATPAGAYTSVPDNEGGWRVEWNPNANPGDPGTVDASGGAAVPQTDTGPSNFDQGYNALRENINNFLPGLVNAPYGQFDANSYLGRLGQLDQNYGAVGGKADNTLNTLGFGYGDLQAAAQREIGQRQGQYGTLGQAAGSQVGALANTTGAGFNQAQSLIGGANAGAGLGDISTNAASGYDFATQAARAQATGQGDQAFTDYGQAQLNLLNAQRQQAVEAARGRLQSRGVEGTALENELAKINSQYDLQGQQLAGSLGVQALQRQDAGAQNVASLAGQSASTLAGIQGQGFGQTVQQGTALGGIAGQAGGTLGALQNQGFGQQAATLGAQQDLMNQNVANQTNALNAQTAIQAQNFGQQQATLGAQAGLAGTSFNAQNATTGANNQVIDSQNQNRQAALESISNLLGIDTARVAANNAGIAIGNSGGKK